MNIIIGTYSWVGVAFDNAANIIRDFVAFDLSKMLGLPSNLALFGGDYVNKIHLQL